MSAITPEQLYECCKIAVQELEKNPKLKIPFRLCKDSAAMGNLMANELVNEIRRNNERGKTTRAIIPCGPSCWYEPFARIVNHERVSLRRLVVFTWMNVWTGKETSFR